MCEFVRKKPRVSPAVRDDDSMRGFRFWVLALALLCLLAGFIAGKALPRVMAGDTNRDASTARDLAMLQRDIAAFSLSNEQTELLRQVLAVGRIEEMEILSRCRMDDFSQTLRERIQAVRSRTEKRKRGLLDAEQRARFDELKNHSSANK